MNLTTLHGPTVNIMMAVVVTLMTCVALAVWRFNRGLPGLAQWALASLSGFAVLLMYQAREFLPELPAVLLTNFLLVMVAYLSWTGSLAYVGKAPPPRYWVVSGLMLFLLLMAYFTQWQADVRMRVYVQSLAVAGLYALAVRVIAVGGLVRYPARYLFGLAMGGHAVFLVTVRLWQLLEQAALSNGKVVMPPLVALESMVFFIVLTIGVVLLVIEHISQRLIVLAENDGLTNVFNRRAFLTVLEKACSQANRNGTPVALLAVDLDHFKRINDTWGHRAGDDVLRNFAKLAVANVRMEDVIGRLGGEEFGILLPAASLCDAREIAERIRQACEADAVVSGGHLIRYTASIGVARYQVNEMPEVALHRADQAMYRAKNAGRNRVEIQEEA